MITRGLRHDAACEAVRSREEVNIPVPASTSETKPNKKTLKFSCDSRKKNHIRKHNILLIPDGAKASVATAAARRTKDRSIGGHTF